MEELGRRLDIIYFLSRDGHVEQPHLLGVHHLTPNGVHLRDVKKWLGELHGKDMPEAFSWSYKRRYKTGYIWQDLTKDDLIIPISDNEYVLKGSNFLFEENRASISKNIDSLAKSEIQQELSVSDDDLLKDTKNELPKSEERSSAYGRSKSYSIGSSQRLRTFLSCGDVDTDDAVFVKLNTKKLAKSPWGSLYQTTRRKSFDVIKGNEICMSKPGVEPICSQCGELFKPDKMHAHMKSCPGLRAARKNDKTLSQMQILDHSHST